jgi:hypothetical protein
MKNFPRKFISNSRNNFIKHDLYISMLNEDEKNLYQQKKNRFFNQISKTELELFENELNLKPLNPKHNVFNNKIMNQIKSISKKIYKNNSQEKKLKKLHNILFIEPKYNYIYNKNNNNNSINNRNNSFQNISNRRNNNINQSNEKDNIKNSKSFSNKKYFYFMKTEKDKIVLPPINQFKYKVHRLKLNINHNEDKDQEEKMMKLYKELEFQSKHKFVV